VFQLTSKGKERAQCCSRDMGSKRQKAYWRRQSSRDAGKRRFVSVSVVRRFFPLPFCFFLLRFPSRRFPGLQPACATIGPPAPPPLYPSTRPPGIRRLAPALLRSVLIQTKAETMCWSVSRTRKTCKPKFGKRPRIKTKSTQE
jgi:hypothetical protein